MFSKIKISEIFHNLQLRFFNTTSMSGRASKLVQFHSGGDDFCPTPECEGLGDCIGGNPADGFVLAWRDDVTRKSKPGEKRIYALKKDEETGEVVAVGEVYLQNDGSILISGSKDLNIVVLGNAKISANTVELEATKISSSGTWVHNGNFTADHIESGDGASGTFDKTQANKGIVTGGS